MKLRDLLKWLTGSYHRPPLGFLRKFKVTYFAHCYLRGCRCRPTASTCDTMIKLPVHIKWRRRDAGDVGVISFGLIPMVLESYKLSVHRTKAFVDGYIYIIQNF